MWHRGKVHEWTSGAFHQVFRLIHMPNIIVLVKQVPDTNAKIVVSGDRVDLSSVKMVMSPYDEFAVETALQHREASGGEVTALTVGGPGAEKILKDAKAILAADSRDYTGSVRLANQWLDKMDEGTKRTLARRFGGE